jgi:transcriptional regulator with AAA-type ATPase domain/tetratricopeptide (TPR) repeat protein
MLASLNNNLGCAAEKEALYDEALASYTRCESIGSQRGERYNQALAWLNQAGVHLKLNNLTEAERLAKRSTKLAIEFGDRLLQGYATVYRAQIYRRLGEANDANEYIDDAWRSASQTGHREIRLMADLERAQMSLDKGEYEAAASIATAVRQEATAHMITESAAYAAVCVAEAYRRRRSLADATEALSVAWSILADGAFPEVEWRAHLVNGKLQEENTASDQADRHFRAGSAIVESLAAGIRDSEQRDNYLREPLRMEMRVKGARALSRSRNGDGSNGDALRDRSGRPSSTALTEHCRVLSSVGSLEAVCQALLENAIRVTRAEHAVVLRSIPGEGTGVSILDSVGLGADREGFRPRLDLVTRAVEGEVAFGPSIYSRVDVPAQLRGSFGRGGCAVPIPDASGVWGVLYVAFPEGELGGAYPVEILQAMAAQAGLVIAGISADASARCAVVSPETLLRPVSFGELSSVSSSMVTTFSRLRGIASTMAPVLLQGESGTGKELAARAIHGVSARASGPFVAIDCGAIPEGLAEVELFGCLRGAFSGASELRTGLVATSHRGTLFLDEVGNMPLALQAKFLRVLQTGEVRAVGAARTRTVDFRLVAATNSDLEAEVRAGRFRQDLYYRLTGLLVRLPPLRERRADIAYLATQLVQNDAEDSCRSTVTLSEDAVSLLRRHDWPGNVRELRHAILAARALAGGGPILGDHVSKAIQAFACPGEGGKNDADGSTELRALTEALTATRGDKAAAARRLGWSRMRVYRVLRRSPAAIHLRPE